MSSKRKHEQVEEAGGEDYPIFEVANVRVTDGLLEYLVRWERLTFESNSWLKEECISSKSIETFQFVWDSAVKTLAPADSGRRPPPHTLKTKRKQQCNKSMNGGRRKCPHCGVSRKSQTGLSRHVKECLKTIRDCYYCIICMDHFEDKEEFMLHTQEPHFREIGIKEGLVLFRKGSKVHLRYGKFNDAGGAAYEEMMHFPVRSWQHLKTLMFSKSLSVKPKMQQQQQPSNIFIPFFEVADRDVTHIVQYKSDKATFIIEVCDLIRNLMENTIQSVTVVFFILKIMIENVMNDKPPGLSVSLRALLLKGSVAESLHILIQAKSHKAGLTFVPMLTAESSHFVLAVIDDKKGEIRVYDSNVGVMKNKRELLRACAKEYNKRNYRIVDIECKQQRKNENSCAYYAIMFAFKELMGLGEVKQLKLGEIRQMKLLIFKEICSQSEIGVNLLGVISNFLDFPSFSYLPSLCEDEDAE